MFRLLSLDLIAEFAPDSMLSAVRFAISQPAPISHPMGHSRQDGGFAEAPLKPIEGYPDIPVSPAGLIRPEFSPRADFVPFKPPKPPKSEGGKAFRLVSPFEPKGDQPTAIAELVNGITAQERDQVLLGVTGSGKT